MQVCVQVFQEPAITQHPSQPADSLLVLVVVSFAGALQMYDANYHSLWYNNQSERCCGDMCAAKRERMQQLREQYQSIPPEERKQYPKPVLYAVAQCRAEGVEIVKRSFKGYDQRLLQQLPDYIR